MSLIFISSPQEEFRRIRRELCYFILTEPYLSQYFDVFLFENLPANRRNPENNYLEKIEECHIYIGLLGRTYGTENADGLSATELEYNYASELGRDRIVFLKELPRRAVHEPKMEALINRAGEELTYKSFSNINDLKLKVMQSLLYWQQLNAN